MARYESRGEQLLMELQARDAWNQRDYVRAQELAEQTANAALDSKDEAGWWNAKFLASEALRKQGRMHESKDVAELLEAQPLTKRSKALAARVSTLMSFALQGTGDLPGAVRAARTAVAHTRDAPGQKGIFMEAENALIAALADSDQLDDAWKECLILADLLSTEPNSQATGLGYWAIGNVAFLLRRVEEGVAYHELAANNLSPTNDLDLWARFNLASASLRLTAGIVEPETLECIERAELASSIVGGSERDRLELRVPRAQWLVLTGQYVSAIEQLTAIVEQKGLLATHVAAQVHFLLGQALSAGGHTMDAVVNLEASEGLFLQSGAEESASSARALIASIGA
ncbi:hypothetical protein [Arthrobacter pityocampae]|uniref:hypothetical protein n=1 Tax=Arthrobacter pityocampae TaxID=547334 RepID=UPI003736D5F2